MSSSSRINENREKKPRVLVTADDDDLKLKAGDVLEKRIENSYVVLNRTKDGTRLIFGDLTGDITVTISPATFDIKGKILHNVPLSYYDVLDIGVSRPEDLYTRYVKPQRDREGPCKSYKRNKFPLSGPIFMMKHNITGEEYKLPDGATITFNPAENKYTYTNTSTNYTYDVIITPGQVKDNFTITKEGDSMCSVSGGRRKTARRKHSRRKHHRRAISRKPLYRRSK